MLKSERAKSCNSAPTKGYNGTNIYAKKHVHHKKRFTRTGTFPFFGLPREIRDIIYVKVFETSLQDSTITPDPAHTRRESSRYEESRKQRTISNVLGLLLVCRRANEEAMEALYGRHIFYFDDTKHDTKHDLYKIKVEASAHCYYCRGEFAGRCFDGSPGQHYIHVPWCDLVGMHEWLFAIGEENWLKIRHIQLHFSGTQFVKFLGERHWGGSDYLWKPSPVGGDILARALKLLGNAHNLETFRISFNYPPFDEASEKSQCRIQNQRLWARQAFELLFQPEKPRNLKAALCSITGIKKLICENMSTANDSNFRVTDGARARLGQVIETMEFGHPSRLRPGETLAYSQSPHSGKWTNRWKVSSPWPEASMRRL